MSEQIVFGDEYNLLWSSTQEGQVGEVYNYAINRKGCRAFPILLDDDWMKRNNMRFIAHWWDDRFQPKITVSSPFLQLAMNFKEAGTWHEIGHIHHEHLLKMNIGDQTLKDARIAAIENGQIMPIEAEADRFAVDHIGKGQLIDFLTYLLESRPADGQTALNSLGKRELQLRIETIRAL